MYSRPRIDLAASLHHVAQGGIPLRAQERLASEAGPHRRLFTSDLSVSEFVLARDVQCEPISQVMGSSIYFVGQIPDYKGQTGEITIISDAHREARRRAIARLYQEAAFVRADAVIGARLTERMITMGQRGKGGDDGGEVLEFTVVGTAVRAPWITHPPGQPVITDLSGQELWALAKDGYEPCCFLFEFCRYHVWHVTPNGRFHGEILEATQAIESARNIAATKIQRQAAAFQCEFVVGSDITLKVKEVPCGANECSRNDLDVDLSWLCTGVRRIPGARWRTRVDVPPLTLTLTPLGRRRGDVIEGGDDAEEIEIEAENAEEAAVEAEEGR
ncbi:MAG TPA: heavy metal-binding domain-containing protein [Polyangiaceae bacterium]|nr:heavy metal-binding domain-containing protein [Polyangiaceae bacterium]